MLLRNCYALNYGMFVFLLRYRYVKSWWR